MWHRAEVIRSGSHLTIGNNRASQVSANDNLKASGSFIKVDPSGVTLSGPMVNMNTGGALTGAARLSADKSSPETPGQNQRASFW